MSISDSLLHSQTCSYWERAGTKTPQSSCFSPAVIWLSLRQVWAVAPSSSAKFRTWSQTSMLYPTLDWVLGSSDLWFFLPNLFYLHVSSLPSGAVWVGLFTLTVWAHSYRWCVRGHSLNLQTTLQIRAAFPDPAGLASAARRSVSAWHAGYTRGLTNFVFHFLFLLYCTVRQIAEALLFAP